MNIPATCTEGIHLWVTRKVLGDMFRIMECENCGLVDPCGVPDEILQAALGLEKKEESASR